MKLFLAGILSFLMINLSWAQTPKVETAVIKTSAVCGMCKETIETALFKTKGVISANVDLATKEVTVQYRTQKVTVEALRTAINHVGYDADETAADPVAYDKLEGCCKKEANAH